MPTQGAAKSSRENEGAAKGVSASIPVNSARDQVNGRLQERISGRAYDLYQRGQENGQDLRHWLQAESEILPEIPEIRESSSWFTVNVPLRGFNANEIQVTVEPNYAIVAAEKQESSASEPARASDVLEQTIYTQATWPSPVDPKTASAYLKNDILTLTVKRSDGNSADVNSSI
jgi:HSP20 family molecular chaperone IbpA